MEGTDQLMPFDELNLNGSFCQNPSFAFYGAVWQLCAPKWHSIGRATDPVSYCLLMILK